MNENEEVKFELEKNCEAIGFSKVNEFLENHPKFNVYMANPVQRQLQRSFNIDQSNLSEFSLMKSAYLVNSSDDVVTMVDLSFDLNDDKFIVYRIDWLS